MGYLDYTDSWLRALTRQRRQERLARKAEGPHTAMYRIGFYGTHVPRSDRTPYTRKSNRKLRGQMWEEGRRRCYYCSCLLTMTPGRDDTLTVEHKQPQSRGGQDEPENREPACAYCNNEKSDMTEQEYYDFLLQRLTRKRAAG